MNATRRAGMLRLRNRGSFVALALLSPGAIALGQGASAGPIQTRATAITTRDSTRKAIGEMVVVRQMTPRIDSLVRRLDNIPLGSPEYLATEDSLRAAMQALSGATTFTKRGGAGGTFSVQIAPGRAALRGSAFDVIPQGWFGFGTDGINVSSTDPSGSWVRYFEYPTVVQVEANSPGSKAGIRFGDSVLAFNGLDLRQNPINLTRLLTPGAEVSVKLRRDGESKELTILVEKAPAAVMAERRNAAVSSMASAQPTAFVVDSGMDRRLVELRAAAGLATAAAGGRATVTTGSRPARAPAAAGYVTGAAIATTVAPSMNGVYGAAMTDVDADLAGSIVGLKGKRGVFVERVPVGSLAERMGLKRGDVILKVDSNDVPNTDHLRLRILQADANHASKVRLVILRAGRTRDLIVDLTP